MILKKIEIRNFRSYYGDNKFELGERLNIVIGSNGDGKTTLYDALEWLFRTDGTIKADTKFISQKRIGELIASESDDVCVALTYEHNTLRKRLEKTFRFTKSFDDEVTTSNYTFQLIEDNGVERIIKEGMRFDYDLPVELRRYIMFKGESDLDVFQQSNALQMLIDTFSDVKDFEAYSKFMAYALRNAESARDHAQDTDRRNQNKIQAARRTIEREKGILFDIDKEIELKEKEATDFEGLLQDIERSKETSQLLISTNQRIDSLKQKQAETRGRIREEYTIDLLDNMWIIMGLGPIAKEYSEKIAEFDRLRRKEEKEYEREVGRREVIESLKHDFTPLPVYVPGEQIMKEMLEEEVCKICGRPAKKHSPEWDFMLQRLNEYQASLKPAEKEVKPCYQNDYIVELQKRDTTLNDNMYRVTRMRRTVLEAVEFNKRRHDELNKIEANLEDAYESKKRILAQADGLTEDQLLSRFENISNWMDQKHRAIDRKESLKQQRAAHLAELEKAQEDLGKLTAGTPAAIYSQTWDIINQITKGFESAKRNNKNRLLAQIEDEANSFMDKLNTNDFKGTIRIIEKPNSQGEAILVNNDGTRIYTPNTALRTTYLMSVLFAIGKLSSLRNETEFPLFFDAPTSSFTAVKENKFFDVISHLDKQVVIITKSYLKESKNGNSEIDMEKVNAIEGRVFRIEKKMPFDDKDLRTIQTIVSVIK